MGKPLLIIPLVLLPFIAFSQTSFLDSLTKELPRLQDTDKVKALNTLAFESQRYSLQKSMTFAEEALEIAIRIADKPGIANTLDQIGFTYREKFDYTHAMKYFLDAMKIRDEIGDRKGQAVSRNNIGRLFYLQENYSQAKINLEKSLVLWESIHDTSLVGLAEANKNIADVYLATKVYGKAKDHYSTALELLIEAKDLDGAAKIASHLGNISTDLCDYESALVYYRTSLNLHREIKDLENVAIELNRIAQTQLAQDSPLEALEAAQSSFDLFQQADNKFGMAMSLKTHGQVYARTGQVNEAKEYLERSNLLLKGLNSSPGTHNIFLEISAVYAEMGEYDKAYKAHLEYTRTKDSVLNQEKTKALLDLTTRYESEFEAKEREQRIALLELENANAKKIRWFLVSVIGLIGILLTNVWLSFRRKKKDNFLLKTKNEEIVRQKNEIDGKNIELKEKNESLDLLNQKLVNEIAERENIERSSFARDRFLATMSHEMRTPLNVITGLTHILLESKPRTDQIEHLRTLQFSANDLVVFINDVLDFSKIEAGKLHLEDREFLPAKTFSEIEQRFEKTAEGKGVLLHMHFDTQIPEKLMGDSARLNQILTNLLTNAFQHTDDGMVNSSVTVQEQTQKEVLLKIVVEDNDDNPDRVNLDDAFKPWKKNVADFEGYDGKYLSLVITKRLIELQNGKLVVENKPGYGTAFIAYLPFKLSLQPAQKKEERAASSFGYLSGSRILVVEDNKINQLVVAKMLRKLGIEVTTADNGLEALKIYNEEEFDLVLMDIQMPEMDGYRTTAEIRRHFDPAKREVPIIALTASAFLTEKEKARLFGMNDHVGKPFSPEELLEKISTCLKIRKNA